MQNKNFNTTINLLLQHRSNRKYNDRIVSEDVIETIVRAAEILGLGTCYIGAEQYYKNCGLWEE